MGLLTFLGIGPISRNARERDKALIVGFLRVFGAGSVLDMKVDMEDFTRGEHDWCLRSDRTIHVLLRELEGEDAVCSQPDRIHGRLYKLVASEDKLLKVD